MNVSHPFPFNRKKKSEELKLTFEERLTKVAQGEPVGRKSEAYSTTIGIKSD